MKRKRSSSLLCILICVVLAGGCGLSGADFDASGYVKASLDMSYHGESAQFIELTEATAEQATQMYEEIVAANLAEITAGMILSAEQEVEFDELCRRHLANVTYTVKEAEKISSSEYTVDVVAKKLIAIDAEDGVIEQYNEELEKRIAEGEFNEMEDDEFKAQCSAEILDIYREYVNNPEYGEETTVTVRVERDSSESTFYIGETDLADLTAALH